MKKLIVLLGTFWVLCGVVGCGLDQREQLIAETLTILNDTTGVFNTLKTDLRNVLDERKKENKPILDTDLAPIRVKAEAELKGTSQRLGLGKRLQRYKEATDAQRETTTDEQRAELAKKYRGKLQDGLADLDKAKTDLEDALQAVERTIDQQSDNASAKEELRKLRESLKDGYAVFELITKLR